MNPIFNKFCLQWATVIFGLWLILSSWSAFASPNETPWFERVLVGMEVGPTGAQFAGGKYASDYAAHFSGKEIVQRCVEANAEYLVLWVRDGEFTFHNSKLLPKPPGQGERDVLLEAVEEGRKAGLLIIAYCQLQYPAFELRQHPEWKVIQSNGNPINHLVCFNTGYVEHVKALLAEMLSYGIDGFHLDMVDQGFGPPAGCWCDSCKKLFEKEYDRPMPQGVDWESEDWDRMLQFRYSTSDRFEKALTEYIRSVDPKSTVDFNYHGAPPFSWDVGQTPVRHANNGDFVTGEAGLWAFGALTASFNAAWYRAATPDKPFQVAVQRGVRMYHDQTTRPLNDMRWEMFTLLAHGAFVTMIDKTAYDGWLDPVAYDRIGQLLGEARTKREHFGQSPVNEVGIYFSARTRDWIGRDQSPNYYQSVQGAHKALVYEHLGFGFLFDESLTLDKLKQYPVVCLPNAGILSEKEVCLFRQYVEDGGSLLITGQSGMFDTMGTPLNESVLSDLVGAKVKGLLKGDDYWMRFPNTFKADEDEGEEGEDKPSPTLRGNSDCTKQMLEALTADVPTNWPFLVRGRSVIYEPITATPLGELLDSHRVALTDPEAYNKDWPLSAREVVGPAALVNFIGKGKVLTFAGSPGNATAGEHHIVETRKLLANAVRLLNPNPRVRVTAPSNVEAVVTDDPNTRTLRIHLIAYNSTPQTTPAKNRPYVLPGLIEDTPIFRVGLEFRDSVNRVEAFNSNTQIRINGKRVEMIIEDIHDVIQGHY